ncbi:MAG: DUF370 domain-containing protein [Thermoanaerobacteraceae bacterium]|nr:DUF370 domain-containing protein [Thermoanaerobacteraceae bacterium]
MFLHIGGNIIVPLKNLIGIIDYTSSASSEINQEFINIYREEGFLKNKLTEDVKSLVLVEEDNKYCIYCSPISSVTLYKRANNPYEIIE